MGADVGNPESTRHRVCICEGMDWTNLGDFVV